MPWSASSTPPPADTRTSPRHAGPRSHRLPRDILHLGTQSAIVECDTYIGCLHAPGWPASAPCGSCNGAWMDSACGVQLAAAAEARKYVRPSRSRLPKRRSVRVMPPALEEHRFVRLQAEGGERGHDVGAPRREPRVAGQGLPCAPASAARLRARSQLPSAATSEPKCSGPLGDRGEPAAVPAPCLQRVKET